MPNKSLSENYTVEKTPWMFYVMAGLWALCLLYFNPRFLALLIGPEFFLAKLFLFLFIGVLNLFWFYVFFHLVIVSFSYFGRHGSVSALKTSHPLTVNPRVALLYTTCNDFQEKAVFSHLNQDYLDYHLFILDDSTSCEYKNRIDEFAQRNLRQVTVIRRQDRDGFKAGNVNHALSIIDAGYEYFSISDADTILPPTYIKGLLPYVLYSNIAFAQASQKANPYQAMPFAQSMGLNTDIHFQHYAVTKNRFGFVMWYGHGAMMRRDIYNKIGGFPEIVTEDLAYSIKIREAGYEGVFVKDVVCLEDFPATYQQYRKRNEKWIRGTTECLLKFYPAFLKTKHIPWFEKLDVFVSAVSLLLAFPFTVLLLLVGIALPIYYTHFQFQGPMFRMPIIYERFSLLLVTQIQSNLFWSWDVFLLMIATIFAPLIPAVTDSFRQPKKLMKYVASYIFCFFSIQVASTIHFLVVLFTKKAVFPVTGDNGQSEHRSDEAGLFQRKWFLQSHANHQLVLFMEAIMGFVFCMIGLATRNVWFLPIAVALGMSPCLFQWNLDSKLMRYVVFMPLLMTLGIIYFIGRRLPGL